MVPAVGDPSCSMVAILPLDRRVGTQLRRGPAHLPRFAPPRGAGPAPPRPATENPATPTGPHPHPRQIRNTRLTHVERTSRLPRPLLRAGVPLAPPPRAVSDAARRLRSGREIAELVSDAVQRKLCTVAQLSAELDDGQRRGSAT